MKDIIFGIALAFCSVAHATDMVCTNGSSLNVHDQSLTQVLFTANDGEGVNILSTPAPILSGGVTYVPVQFPDRATNNTGWAAEEWIKASCPAVSSTSSTVTFNPADMNNPNDWKRQYFDLVVAINRNAAVETLDAYYKGAWVKHVEVSTAVEATLTGTNLDGTPNTIFATTPPGYHVVLPGALQIDHHSTAFDESYMPFAVFYNQPGGLATHEAPPGSEGSLGTRASHGCVRLPREDAIDLFFLVAFTGGPFSPDNFSGECPSGYGDVQACQNAAATNTTNDRALATTAIALGHSRGMSAYASVPQVPQVSTTGQLITDATGAVKMQAGYRALYVVIDSPLPPGVLKIPSNAPQGLVLGIPQQDDSCLVMSTNKDTWGKPDELLSSKCLYEPSGPPNPPGGEGGAGGGGGGSLWPF